MKSLSKVDPRLKDFAVNEQQKRTVDAVNKHGGIRAAARALGTDNSVLCRSLGRLRKRAAMMGYSPDHDMIRTVPEPFVVRGVSTYYGKDGEPRGQWVKSHLPSEALREAIEAAVDEMKADIRPVDPVPAPADSEANLCNVYTLTDCHVGQRSWAKETGADWDLEISERVLMSAFEHLVTRSPASDVGIVAQLGDFLHWDGLIPITPTHGHVLDADSRFSKVVRVAVRILRRVIDLARARHRQVVVLMAEGNHDMASAIWLRHLFALLYENEPRVRVIDAELPYYAHQHGQTMLAWHHGHLRKPDELPLLLAAQFPTMWGTTKYRYVHMGHRHHVYEREHAGITVIQHPTLAARDAHAARGGWLSNRQVTGMTYHVEYGQVARNTVVPEMLADRGA